MSWVFAGVRKSVTSSKYDSGDDNSPESKKPTPTNKERRAKYEAASREMKDGGGPHLSDSGSDDEIELQGQSQSPKSVPKSPGSKRFMNTNFSDLTKGIVNFSFTSAAKGNKQRKPRKVGVYYHPDGTEWDNRERWYSIDPHGTFRKNWDLTQAFILVFVSITVPFRVGLKQPAEGPSYWVELAIDLYFWFDILFNFCTGYEAEEEEGVIVYHPKLIRENYFKTWFTIDLLACLPVDLALRATEGTLGCSMEIDGCPPNADDDGTGQLFKLFKLLRLFRLVKLLRLFKIMRLFERYQDDLFKYMHLISVAKLVIFMLYLGHLFGCFFHYFSVSEWRTKEENQQVEDGTLEPWLKSYFGDDEPTGKEVWDRYIASIYWAFTTMTTVGYGDISATTRVERVIACFGMIVGGFVFSGVIATMADVMANANPSKKAHSEKMDKVSAFVRDNNLPREFLKDVLQYFRKQQTQAYDPQTILMEMPYNLRRSLLMHQYGHIIHKVPLFDVDGDGSLDDHVFVTELCMRMKLVSFMNEQMIFQMGEIGRHMFIISSGKVEVLDSARKDVMCVLEAGAYFGEGCVLGDVRRRENLRALGGNVELCCLEREDVDVLLDSYPHMQRLLHDSYYKRKELFKRFEEARVRQPKLTMNEFISAQNPAGMMSPQSKKRILGEAPAGADDGEDTVGNLPPSRPKPGKSLQRLESWNVKDGKDKAEFLSEGQLEAQDSMQGSMDPTLNFVLSEEVEREKEEHMDKVRSFRAGGGGGGWAAAEGKALTRRVQQVEETQRRMEGKVDQLVALLTERMAAEGTPVRGANLSTPEIRGGGATLGDGMTPRL